MKEEFDPKDFASFEELPEDKKPEFEPVEGGFVRESAIEDERKAEYMAHAENSIRSKIDEAIEIAMSKIKNEKVEKAESAGELVGKEYDMKKIIDEYKNIENLQVVRMKPPACCETSNISDVQNVAYQMIGSGEVSSDTFVMKGCTNKYFLIKNKKIITVIAPWKRDSVEWGAVEYFDSLRNS